MQARSTCKNIQMVTHSCNNFISCINFIPILCVHLPLHTCTWRPKGNLRCHALAAVHFDLFETRSQAPYNSLNRLGWVAIRPQGAAWLQLPSIEIISMPSHTRFLLMWSLGIKLGPYDCQASTLPTDPSSQPYSYLKMWVLMHGEKRIQVS